MKIQVAEVSMGKMFADHSVSLGGFGAGTNIRMDNPMGDGSDDLHAWQFRGGLRPEVLENLFGRSTGAVVVGRHTFDLGEKPWGDDLPFHLAGLLNELRLHLVHILLGGGTSLFSGLDPASLALERTRLTDAEGVTHISFRVERPG